MRKTLSFVSLLIAILLLAVPVRGQIFSDDDTLSVITANGFAGDTITVPVDLINTFHVGGMLMRVLYDSLAFEPLSVDTTSRSNGWELNGAYFGDPGVIRFFASSMHPLENAIPPGEGPVAVITLRIRDEAAPGLYDLMMVDEDSSSYDNSLSDSLGMNLIIPILIDGQIEVSPQTGIESDPAIPKSFGLAQNYPNPFNRKTIISFTMATPGHVDLEILDLLGRRVTMPYSGWIDVGEVSVVWDGRSEQGEEVASGIYYYRLRTPGGKSITRRMTLLK